MSQGTAFMSSGSLDEYCVALRALCDQITTARHLEAFGARRARRRPGQRGNLESNSEADAVSKDSTLETTVKAASVQISPVLYSRQGTGNIAWNPEGIRR
jgi:hypothetical protein